jgi:hypothetical protein
LVGPAHQLNFIFSLQKYLHSFSKLLHHRGRGYDQN